MSIPLNSECILCRLRRHEDTARKLGDEKTATAFFKEMMRRLLDMPEGTSSPELAPMENRLFQEFYGLELDRFREEKLESNRYVLSRLDKIRSQIAEAEDPLYRALQFAILGNYIDFSALHGQVSYTQLDQMLDKAAQMDVEPEAYRSLRQELAAGKKLLYLTDNAGEIGFDRVFGEQLQKAYPHLRITFCVRGIPVYNDATREDALQIGIPFEVIDNGNGVGGTDLKQLSPEAKKAMDAADVIIAKGQGNTETLYGCGYNIYYAFLVKCDRFVKVFGKPLMTPMLVRE